MIAYFDTSALVPLITGETTSVTATALWQEADRLVSSRLLYVETRAALGRANREGRLLQSLSDALRIFHALFDNIEIVEATQGVVARAGDLAEHHSLRGYDAVHLASAEAVADDDFVMVSNDYELCNASKTLGLAIAYLKETPPR